MINELCHYKTCLWDFRPGPTQIGLDKTEDGKRFDIMDLGSGKQRS